MPMVAGMPRRWSIADSIETYNIRSWGGSYFGVNTAGNVVVSDAIEKVHEAVKEGESIVTPLQATGGVFPNMVISMVDVGEETGQLPEMLLKVADVYDDEVDNAVTALTSILEPIMIVVLALVVGAVVFALFLPLIKIISEMGNM